jgi:Tfp pilus assembly protein PilN
VRPVNLIPASDRPSRPSGGKSGSAYAVVGVLALLFVGAVLYVVTSNQVNTRKTDALEAKRDADAAEAKIASLGVFGDFVRIAQTRTASIQTLASGRFDWERLARELAHVLPRGTWLREVDASVASTDQPQGGTDQSTVRSSGGPQAKLKGCAKRQSDVARFMVRLRRMHRVEDVGLADSKRGTDTSSGSSSVTTCGRLFEFNVTVAFTVPTTPADGSSEHAPRPLGGGS